MDKDTVQMIKSCGPDLKASDYPIKIVGALFLFRESDQSLILQLRDEKPNLRHPGLWVPPGGHSESNETIEECTRREFYEETNYCCDEIKWSLGLEVRHPQWPPYLLGMFWAYYDGKQELKCQEGQDLKFKQRNEANSLPMPAFIFPVWDKILNTFAIKS